MGCLYGPTEPFGSFRQPTSLEGFRMTEHPRHIGDPRHIPLGQVLVEGLSRSEHAAHVGDAGHIPLGQILIEEIRIPEHQVHIGDA